MFEQIKFVLINTTHPGNIGASARAIKNMGFNNLSLVTPQHFPSKEAEDRASGAEDVLVKAEVVDVLDQALANCHRVVGLSVRTRKLSWPTLNPKNGARELINILKKDPHYRIAVLFGTEQSGLSNEEIAKCHYQITIPANPEYDSLNLSQAVQIMAYELRLAILEAAEPENLQAIESRESLDSSESGESLDGSESSDSTDPLATMDEMENFFTHLELTLTEINFLDPQKPGYLMMHLRRLYGRSRLTKTELNILRGILTATQKSV